MTTEEYKSAANFWKDKERKGAANRVLRKARHCRNRIRILNGWSGIQRAGIDPIGV